MDALTALARFPLPPFWSATPWKPLAHKDAVVRRVLRSRISLRVPARPTAVWIGGGRLGAGRHAPLVAATRRTLHSELSLCEFVRPGKGLEWRKPP
jgi:hypothetical protein